MQINLCVISHILLVKKYNPLGYNNVIKIYSIRLLKYILVLLVHVRNFMLHLNYNKVHDYYLDKSDM